MQNAILHNKDILLNQQGDAREGEGIEMGTLEACVVYSDP